MAMGSRIGARAWNSEIRSQIDFANPSYTAGI